MKTIFAAVLLLATTSVAAADTEILRFYGYAYDLKSNRYLYTEVHEQKVTDNHWVSGSITWKTSIASRPRRPKCPLAPVSTTARRCFHIACSVP